MTVVTRSAVLLLASVFLVAACSSQPSVRDQNVDDFLAAGGTIRSQEDRERAEEGSILGPRGLTIGGGGGGGTSEGTGIGVNAFLWGASLDTLSFLPITSADPFGGVIITDWYTPPESPNERLKVNTFILSRELRSDGVRVSVFKQIFDASTGNWIEAPVDGTIGRQLEDAILAAARERRVSAQ